MSSEAALSRRGNHEDLVSSVYAAKTSICLLQGSNKVHSFIGAFFFYSVWQQLTDHCVYL